MWSEDCAIESANALADYRTNRADERADESIGRYVVIDGDTREVVEIEPRRVCQNTLALAIMDGESK